MDLETRRKIAEAVRKKSRENQFNPEFLEDMRLAQKKYGTISQEKLNRRLNI